MAEMLVQSESLIAIADAIREKAGTTDSLVFPGGFVEKIMALGSKKLPEGYTELPYIGSSGTQYIDTGFAPNNNSRVVIDVLIPTIQSGNAWFWGSREATSSGRFTCYSSDGKIGFGFNTTLNIGAVLSTNTRHVIDANKNVCALDGASVTATASTFQNTKTLYLFCENRCGSAQSFASFQLYSCQIYDNGTLVRDFAPCKRDSDGAIGLYDVCNSVFYPNNGSGVFYTEGAVNLINCTFTTSDNEVITLVAESGMTWGEYAASQYNAIGAYAQGNYLYYDTGTTGAILLSTGVWAKPTDTIISGGSYKHGYPA